ncbi:MAG TPA: hypothetical protein VF062_20500 [Candidatus Limnocylindrales bacterium]
MSRYSPQSQVALIAAAVVALIGAGLLFVLVVGLLDGVRGIGPVLLGALAAGVFALAGRLVVVARSMRMPAPASSPAQQPAPAPAPERRRPRPH